MSVGQLLGRSEHGQISQACVPLTRVGVEEADDVDAVLGMLEQLPSDELAHFAGADDQGVLAVAAEPLAQRSRDRT